MGAIWYPKHGCDPYIISSTNYIDPDTHPDQIISVAEQQKLLAKVFTNPPIIGSLPWHSINLLIPATNQTDRYSITEDANTKYLRRHMRLAMYGLLQSWRLFEVRLDRYLGLMLFFANRNTGEIRGYYSHNPIIGHAKFQVQIADARVHITYEKFNIVPQPTERYCIKERWPTKVRELVYSQRWYIPPTITGYPSQHL